MLRRDEVDGILSVLAGNLATMVSDLPPELAELAACQSGILARRQILELGVSGGIVSSRLRRGSWQRLWPGTYFTSSVEPGRRALLWAAVLYAGPGAMLSRQTAAELWRLADGPSPLIHVTVPVDRGIKPRLGIALHLSTRAAQAVHPARTPPQTKVEETVLDLWQAALTLDDAVGWVTRAVGRRLTTADKLRQAMTARSRLRWRSELAELLSPDAAGIHSVLEYRYVRHVERPHRLPAGARQARVRRDGRNEYRDTLYEEYETVVELDGQVAHPGDSRWRDIRRDNAAAATGITTLRYGWRDVTLTPCKVAAEIASVLAIRGYAGARPCSPACPVSRSGQGQLAEPAALVQAVPLGSRPPGTRPPGRRPTRSGPGRAAPVPSAIRSPARPR